MLDALTTWLTQHSEVVVAIVIFSVLITVASLLATPWYLAKLPSDYFVIEPSNKPRSLASVSISILRTLSGIAIVLLGLLMMLTPGPGLILLVLGLAICDFPGKHHLVIKLVSQPPVFTALNWMRSKTDKPPFISPSASRVHQ